MITVKNILSEYPKLDQSLLPNYLNKKEFKDLKTYLPHYGKDDDIDALINTFVEALNEKVYNQVNKKHKTTSNTKSQKEILNSLPSWIIALRRYIRFSGKDVSQTTLRNYVDFMQKSFDAKRPGAKQTPNIEIIRTIQKSIIKLVNDNLNKKKIRVYAKSSEIEAIKSILLRYQVKIDRKGKLSEIELSGNNSETDQLSGLGIISSTDLVKKEFQNLQFDGKFKDLIGNPTKPFQIMIYGLPGFGKSTLAILFAKYLATKHNMKILFVAREEGISGTTQEKFIRLDASHPNIHISEKLPVDLSMYDAVFIDSVNEMNLNPDDIRNILNKYPKLSTVQLFKATKEGKFLGQSDFAHLVQAEIKCFEGKAQAQKNRFGGNKEVKILD